MDDGDRLNENVVELVVSRLFTLDLPSASLVSRTWLAATRIHRSSYAPSRLPRPPSLLLHFQGRQTRSNSTAAFDPISNNWQFRPRILTDPFPQTSRPIPLSATGGHGSRLYALFKNALAVSSGSFATPWLNHELPGHWESLAALAVAGQYVVALGVEDANVGGPPNAVVRRREGEWWHDCDPLPDEFTTLEAISVVALRNNRLYVTENKPPRWASRLDIETGRWDVPQRLRIPDTTVYASTVGIVCGRLVVVGANEGEVKFWFVNEETMVVEEEIEGWRMPREMVTAFLAGKGGGRRLEAIGMLSEGNFGYLYNVADKKEFFMFEFREGESWWKKVVPTTEMLEMFAMHRVLTGCSARAEL